MPAKLDILNGTNQGESHDLKASESIIGNRRSADIPIRDPWISWNHAKIFMQNNQFWIEDLGSSNGIYINREKITRAQLNENTLFMLGRTKVRFYSGQAAPGGPPTAPQPPGVPVSVPPASSGSIQTFDIAQGEADQQITELKNELREVRSQLDSARKDHTTKDQELWTAHHNLEQSKRRVRQLEEDLEAAAQGAPPLNERAFPISFRQTLANRELVIDDLKKRMTLAESMASGGSQNVIELQRALEEQRVTYEEKLQMGVRVIYQLEKDLMEKEQAGGGDVEAQVAERAKETETRILADFQRRWTDAEAGWRRELDGARAKIAELQQAPGGATDPAELERLQTELAALQQQKTGVEQELQAAQQRATEAEAAVAGLQQQVAAGGASGEELAQLQQQLADLQAQLNARSEELEAGQGRVSELEAALSEQTAALAEQEAALAAASQASSDSSEAQEESARLREKVSELETEVSELNDRVAELQEELQEARKSSGDGEELESLKEELKEIESTVSRLRRENSSLGDEVANLEEDLEKARNKGSDVDVEEFNEMAVELEDALKLIKRLKNEKGEFEKELIRLEEELDAKGGGDAGDVAALKKQNKELEADLHALEEDLEKKDKQLKAAHKELDALEAELAELEGD